MLLNNNKLAPRLAFIASGAYADPEAAYEESKPYIEAQMKVETAKTDSIDSREAE